MADHSGNHKGIAGVSKPNPKQVSPLPSLTFTNNIILMEIHLTTFIRTKFLLDLDITLLLW